MQAAERGEESTLLPALDRMPDLYEDMRFYYSVFNILSSSRQSGMGMGYIPISEIRGYLDELGIWTAAHQRRQDANVTLVDRYCQAYRGALLRADEMAVPVGPQNADWLEIWADCQRKAELPEFKMFLGLDDA